MIRRRLLWVSFAVALAAAAQPKYAGPVPPKPDLPYLKHGDSLVPTESVMAKEEKKSDDSTYVIDGAASSAKTPLASPILLMKSDKVLPKDLQLFKLDVKGERRELFYPARKPPQAIRIVVTKLTPDGIWRIEVDESLDPGEYSLSPTGTNRAFCFQVF